MISVLLSPKRTVCVGTFDLSYLLHLHECGVNRLSVGVQSFDDHALLTCGRPHTSADVWKALDTISRSPMQKNFNLDLISSLPNISLSVWERSLSLARQTDASHVSVYDLQIEEKSAFGRWVSRGTLDPAPETLSAQCYRRAVELLTEPSSELN